MQIEFNKVTWYSKIAALILFVALPILALFLGVKYGKSIRIISEFKKAEIQTPTPFPIQTPSPTPLLKTAKEVSFSFPYPISFESSNRATASLMKASFQGTNLDLFFKIHAADAGSCTLTLWQNIRRLVNEEGDQVAANSYTDKCTLPNSTISDQKLTFIIPEDSAEIIFLVYKTNGQLETSFTIKVFKDSLRLEPALKSEG